MAKIYIGCSGFYYKEWKDIFYPPKLPRNKWFEFYISQFNTLELNSTFYRFPTMKSLQKWYDTSPEHFMFSAKVPKVVTHCNKFKDCNGYMRDFYGLCEEGLKEKMGCVLFQLHPQIQYSPEMLEKIMQVMDGRFRNVLECRHASWWNENVFKKLKESNITFCGISHPKLPDAVIPNNKRLYYRFHGVPVLYKSSYDEGFLKKIYEGLLESTDGGEIWIYFNNTWGTSAIQNARFLLEKAG